MSHVTYLRVSQATCMDESCHIPACESSHMHGWVMSHTWIKHTSHIYEWDSCMWDRWVMVHTWIEHITYMNETWHARMPCGVATISRLFKITGLFCKRALYKRLYPAKETCNFKEPTNRSHPIFICASEAWVRRHYRWVMAYTWIKIYQIHVVW